MRTAFLALLLVNLMFLAWTEWIDVPASPADAIATLPRLRLASEPPASMADGEGEQGASAAQCLSIGPFNDETSLNRASTLLTAEHLPAHQRVVQGAPVNWYWVYLSPPGGTPGSSPANGSGGSLGTTPGGAAGGTTGSTAQLTQVLHRLRAAGISGAEPMSLGGTPQISLGLFQDPQLAQRQLQLAQQKGFAAVLAQRQISQPVYWLDLWVDGGADTPALQAVKAEVGVPVGISACPPADASALQSLPAGGQAVAPGIPAPDATATPSPASPSSSAPGSAASIQGAASGAEPATH